ncbi:MAG TPA: hypothetical protein VGB67_17470, partial [Fibrella sp.]
AVGETKISAGLVNDTTYEVRARYIARRDTEWSSWVAVTTADIQLGPKDGVGGGALPDGSIPIYEYETVAELPNPPGAGQMVALVAENGKLYRWNGTAWTVAVAAVDLTGLIQGAQVADSAIIAAKIADGAVTVNKVADAAIVTSKIADLALTTAKFADNSVNTSKIAPDSVTAGKLAVGSFDNLIPNGTSEDTTFSPTSPGGQYRVNGGAYAGNWSRGFVNRTDDYYDYVTEAIPCRGGEEFYFEAMGILSHTHSVVCLLMQFIYPDGSSHYAGHYWGNHTSKNVSQSLAWQKLYLSAIAPVGVTTVKFGLFLDNGAPPTPVTAQFDNMFAHRKNTGELIVDGAIKANNIAANAVTTSKLTVGGQGAWLNSDPTFSDAAAWLNGAALLYAVDAGQRVAYSPAGVNTTIIDKLRIPVDHTATYLMTGEYNHNGAANGVLYAGVCLFDDGENIIQGDGSYWLYHPSGVLGPADTWMLYETQFGADTARPFPSNARTMAPVIIFNYTGTAGTWYARNVGIKEAVGQTLIANGAVVTDKLAANSVVAAKIVAGAIETDKLAANAVTAAKINAGAITTDKLAAGSVVASKIEAGAIEADKLAANSVTTDKLAANAITAAKIAAGAITATELAAGAVTADKITAGAIDASKIAAATIVAGNIAANTITATQIGDQAITSAKLADASITSAKIDNAAITSAKIGDAAITSAKIGDLAVNTIHVADGSI